MVYGNLKSIIMKTLFGGCVLCNMVFAASIPVTSVNKDASGVTFTMTPGTMRIDVCTESIFRVRYSAQSTMPNDPNMNFLVEKRWGTVAFTQAETDAEYTITTSNVQVKVNKATGVVAFFDASGKTLLQELASGGKKITPSTISGESTNTCEQIFESPVDEGIYGLGSIHDNIINYHGIPQYLHQVNTHISNPMIISNKGYGILWANASRTYFNLPDQKITLSNGNGQFTTGEAGEYVFLAVDAGLQGEFSIKVNNTKVNALSGTWHSGSLAGKINLSASQTVSVSLQGGGSLYGGPLKNATKFTSRAGQTVDYYFIYGPTPDEVIAGYRLATGAASLFSKGTYGFIQCRERYSSQKEILENAYEFRKRKIPVDMIVQDWNYWTGGWNSMVFDKSAYPNPKQMIDSIHKLHFEYMISVWSKTDGGSAVDNALSAYKIPGTPFFDAYNPQARSVYWSNMNTNLFSLGIDAFWQDADEPEGQNLETRKVNFGSGQVGGKSYANAYPLFVSKTVYEGCRSANDNKRVCIKSRSAFAGSQRFGTMCWNGDIGGNDGGWRIEQGWDWYQRSIPAGLNFCMTGLPYWTTDIGGFFRPGDQTTNAGYHELLARWIEYGAFCPLFRIHGYRSQTEIWRYGTEVENTFRKYDDLRYRLLPYIYSLAGHVTNNGYTMMRGLVMDFRNDPKVLNIHDQFMFGPAFMVCPVTKPGATSRSVYLPEGKWYDFWSGTAVNGGTINADAPKNQSPLYVRAGSIVPMGPSIQYAAEKAVDTIELRIYPGANGTFTIYEDEGNNYNYETGKYSLIPITYNDNSKTVIMGKRVGEFTGMVPKKVFRVVFVGNNHGTGVGITAAADTQIVYNGDGVSIKNIRTRSVNAIAPELFTKTVTGNVVALPVTFSHQMKNIAIYDCSGKLLRSLNTKKNVFDLRKDFSLPTGMYIVKANVLKGIGTK